jgi:hypothetical protein
MTVRIAGLACLVMLAGCAAPPHPTYEFEALYAPAVATPSGLKADLAAFAAQICGGGYDVLDQIFVGEAGPSYVRVRFACT